MGKMFAVLGLTGSRPILRLRKFVVGTVLLLIITLVCGSLYAEAAPSIKFTRVPPKNPGGPYTMGVITGRVDGPHEGLRLVLYARSGRDGKWYVQAYIHQPFTTIQPDSTWNSATHLGMEYAALLVQPEYVPSSLVDSLPAAGGPIVSVAVTEGTPPFWQRWWFRLLVLFAALVASFLIYRWRMQKLARQLNLRFEERLAERTHIAQEIHDTLLQGFLSASMQLHIVNDQLAENSPQREPLAHILKLMGKVIDEGRNAIRGLRPLSVNSYDLEDVLSRLPQELAPTQGADFRLIVEGRTRALHPVIRDEVYRIGREAVANAFRHSGADSVQVELEFSDRELCLQIRDNGRGIDQQVLDACREDRFGLSKMRDRAQNIGATLRIWSSPGSGTELALAVPARIAFESQTSGNLSNWLSKVYLRKTDSSRIRSRKIRS